MSRILSRISMSTGQTSSHALHDVHAHSSSAVTRSKTESAVMVISGASPTTGDTVTPSGPVAAMTAPTFSTISRGARGLAGAVGRGKLLARPQIVDAVGAG